MSYTIYDGWRVPVGVDIIPAIITARRKAHNAAVLKEFSSLVNSSTHHADITTLYRNSGENHPEGLKTVGERESIILSEALRKNDHEKTVLSIHLVSGEDGYHYIIASGYGSYNDYVRDALKDTEAVDYSYWDNSERPESIPEEEWGQRRDMWGRLFAYNQPVNDMAVSNLVEVTRKDGLTPLLHADSPEEKEALITQHVPDNRERTTSLVKSRMFHLSNTDSMEDIITIHQTVTDNYDLCSHLENKMGQVRLDMLNNSGTITHHLTVEDIDPVVTRLKEKMSER